MARFVELNGDQRREVVNTQQRFQAWLDAYLRTKSCRGSMVWSKTKGHEYLLRSSYDKHGRRRQTSLGRRGPSTEHMKAEFERARDEASLRLKRMQSVMDRQAAVNRALGLGRVPLIGARIIRALDTHGLLGAGVRVLGTNAIFAYEAAAGVRFDPELTSTEDIDLLLDSRGALSFYSTDDIEEASLLRILKGVDKSFERTRQNFRAANAEGYLVDLIKPLRSPPWKIEAAAIGEDSQDLSAIDIEGLAWHESAPAFEATVIDQRGEPLRIVTSDPRVFAMHKFWLSQRIDREPIKRRRDGEQALAIAALVTSYMPHLPFDTDALRMMPKKLFEEASHLFQPRVDISAAPP